VLGPAVGGWKSSSSGPSLVRTIRTSRGANARATRLRYSEAVGALRQREIQATRFVLGMLLCVLLALFGVERRIAAYPAHNISASAVAATGIQKPKQMTMSQPQTVTSPELFVIVMVLFALARAQRVWNKTEPLSMRASRILFTTPLAVRPPPSI